MVIEEVEEMSDEEGKTVTCCDTCLCVMPDLRMPEKPQKGAASFQDVKAFP